MTDTEGRASCRKMQQPRHARMRAARQGRKIASRHRRWVGRRRPQTTFLSLASLTESTLQQSAIREPTQENPARPPVPLMKNSDERCQTRLSRTSKTQTCSNFSLTPEAVCLAPESLLLHPVFLVSHSNLNGSVRLTRFECKTQI